MGSHEQSSSGSGFWLTARARCWAEMTKLWLMVAIVALVLSAVQCAKEDDVGLDTREFKQQEKQARILTANQKRKVRKYLPNMFNTSVEGHHTCWHIGGACGLYKCMRFGKCRQLKRGPGKACRLTIGKVCCPCGQKNKREYIKRALERLESLVPITGRGKIRFFKALTQYKIAAASESM